MRGAIQTCRAALKRHLCAALALWLAAAAALAHAPDQKTIAPMLEKVMPAVVNISTSGPSAMDEPLLDDPFFRRFFDLPEGTPAPDTESLGSGVIIDAAEGYVLTNQHVIADAHEINVITADHREFVATIVGVDPEADVALLHVEGGGLRQLPVADSDTVRVGDFVAAIGNPFGLGQTATTGIVSAIGRSGLGLEGYEDFIQTDASINPGNSGGALVNMDGELIGISTAILSPGGGNIGIGFAIPVNMALSIMEQLIKYGEVRRGQLGVHIQDMNPDLAQALDLKQAKGVVVAAVVPDSPAAEAGLQAGDVITHVNAEPVASASALRNVVGLRAIGEKVTLTVLRDHAPRNVTMQVSAPAEPAVGGEQLTDRMSGVVLGPIDAQSSLYGTVQGLLIKRVAPDSAAWRQGLRAGDVIVSVNKQQVRTIDEFNRAAESEKGPLLLNIRRGDAAMFVVLD